MYHTTTDYRLAEYERQYREASLTEHKWNVGSRAVGLWLSSVWLFTIWAIFQGYPVAAASGASILPLLLFAAFGSLVVYQCKNRRDRIRRDVAALGIDAEAWVRQLERSMAQQKATISSTAWAITIVLTMLTGIGVYALVATY